MYVQQIHAKKQGWRKRRFHQSTIAVPAPLCSKTISKFADKMVIDAGLEEFPVECGGGAQFSADRVVMELISSLKTKPSHVHLQIMGDGFRAMHSTNIVSVGARLLIESEEESGDTSFTAIASM